MSTEQTTTQTEQGTTYKGRFAPGNPGRPGNPFARQVATLRKALLDSVTPQDIQDIFGKLTALAKDGNIQAAKLVLSYAIGKPQPAPEPDRMDVDEWDLYRQTTPMKKEAAAVMEAGMPEMHLNYVRMFRPIISEMAHEQAIEMFNEDPAQREAREEEELREMEEDMADAIADLANNPCANLVNSHIPPSTNAFNGGNPPSTNGTNGEAHPSPNGRAGNHAPSTNGKMRQAPPPNHRAGTLPT